MRTYFRSFVRENVVVIQNGSPNNDIIEGDVTDDLIHGGAGNDRITGDVGFSDSYPDDFSGRDLIYGDEGDDTLIGDGFGIFTDHTAEYLGGSDTIHGGTGNDTIVGGPEADALFGDAGADTFIFDFSLATPEYGGVDNFDSGLFNNIGRDVIRDFEVGIDKIKINGAQDISIEQYHSGWTLVKIDVNGDHRTDAQILVHTGTDHVTAADLF